MFVSVIYATFMLCHIGKKYGHDSLSNPGYLSRMYVARRRAIILLLNTEGIDCLD